MSKLKNKLMGKNELSEFIGMSVEQIERCLDALSKFSVPKYNMELRKLGQHLVRTGNENLMRRATNFIIQGENLQKDWDELIDEMRKNLELYPHVFSTLYEEQLSKMGSFKISDLNDVFRLQAMRRYEHPEEIDRPDHNGLMYGTIGCIPEDKDFVLSLPGVHADGWCDSSCQFLDCVVNEEGENNLEPHWGRIYWSLCSRREFVS